MSKPMSRYILGIDRLHLQGSIQISAGIMLVSMTVLVRPLSFPFACLGAIVFALNRLVLGQDHHVGTVLRASCLMLGAYAMSCTAAGVVVTIAVACGADARLPVVLVLGALGLLPLASGRPVASIPGLGLMSMTSCVWFGVIIILSDPAPDIHSVWNKVVVWVILCGFVSVMSGVLVGLTLLPSSAAHELQDHTTAAIRMLGHELSECSSLLFAESRPMHGDDQLGSPPSGTQGSSKVLHYMTSQDPLLADGDTSSSSSSAGRLQFFESKGDLTQTRLDKGARRHSGSDLLRRSGGTTGGTAGGAADGLAKGEAEKAKATTAPARQRSTVLAGWLDWFGGGRSDSSASDLEVALGRPAGAADRVPLLKSEPAQGQADGDGAAPAHTFLHDEPDDAAFLKLLREATRPLTETTARPAYEAPLQARMQLLRAKLARAKDCLPAATCEPLLYGGYHPSALSKWPALLAAANLLVMRVSALMGMVAQDGHLLSSPQLESLFPGELASKYKQAIALLATHCANLAISLCNGAGSSVNSGLRGRRRRVARTVDFRALREELREIMLTSVHNFWRSVEARDSSEPIQLTKSSHLRMFMFTWTLVDGIMQTVANLEKQVHLIEAEQLKLLPQQAAININDTLADAAAGPASDKAHAAAEDPEWSSATVDAVDDSALLPSRSGMVVVTIQPGVMGGAAVQAVAPLAPELQPQQHQPGELIASSGMTLSESFHAHVAFLPGLVPLLFCLPVLAHIYKTFGADLLATVASWDSFVKTIRSRIFQAGFKYYILIVAALNVMVVLPHYVNFFIDHTQLFAYITCCVVIFEKVESTLSRMLLRLTGGILGAVVGFLIMSNSAIAGTPWAVLLFIGGSAALLAPLALSPYRTAFVLLMYTLHAVMLCQYRGPGHAGSSLYFAQRLISLSLGCFVPVLLASLILPWYVTAEALEQLAVSYQKAAHLMSAQYDSYYAALLKKCNAPEADDALLVAQDSAAAAAAIKLASLGPTVPPGKARGSTSTPLITLPPSGGPPGPSPVLALVAMLTRVQMSLALESVVWRRGPLVTPPIVQKLLAAQFLLADRLSALELALDHTNALDSGAFDGWVLEQFVAPMHELFLEAMSKLRELSKVAATVVLERQDPNNADMRRALSKHIEGLEGVRVRMHERYTHLRVRSFLLMKASASLLNARSRLDFTRHASELAKLAGHDEVVKLLEMMHASEGPVTYAKSGKDTALFLSFLFAYTQSLDAMMVVARTLTVQLPTNNAWWAWLKS